MSNPAGLDDSGSSLEAQAAMAAARLVVPSWPLASSGCLHSDPVEVGKGFENDQHATTVTRCQDCGTEFVTEENQ
jgi:hypothetical protein